MSVATEMAVLIRDIDAVDEMHSVERLQKEVWGIPDLDVVPLTQIVAARESGGVILGAFEQDEMIGFVYGFVGRERGRTVHHSHMLAVKPEYRNQNLGYRLKCEQRKRVLDQGIKVITWTFDPLQSLNAFFNFRKLGVIADRYFPDFYGSDASSFLHRNGTDRLWVSWHLTDERVAARLKETAEAPDISDIPTLVAVDEAGEPILKNVDNENGPDRFVVEIPADINTIEKQNAALANDWRLATRNAFSDAIANGYIVEDFVRHNREGRQVGSYILNINKGIVS